MFTALTSLARLFHIARTLAGVTSAGRPLFLKIPYCGPRAIEELVNYDSTLIVGILGGASGPTAELPVLISRIRRENLPEVDRPNDRMPRFSEDRLPDEDLAHLLAWLTQGRESSG